MDPQVIVSTDSSSFASGAFSGDWRTGGPWDMTDQSLQINTLEMKAVLLGLQTLCDDVRGSHIKVRTDNTTCMAYINHKGSSKSASCNILAEVSEESGGGCFGMSHYSSNVEHSGIFPLSHGFISVTPNSAEMEKIHCPQSHQQNPSDGKTPSSHGLSLFQERFEKNGFLQTLSNFSFRVGESPPINNIKFTSKSGSISVNSSSTCFIFLTS